VLRVHPRHDKLPRPVPARLLFVFAKEPRPGVVKTRMCPPLSAVQAARCHEAFTGDVLARMRTLAGARAVLAATPDGDAPVLARTAEAHGVELVWQGSGSLGRRLETALRRGAREGATAVVIGTDSPDLPVENVEMGFAAAEALQVALGPADDGGFYLIGCRGFVPALGELDPPWGSGRVLESTIGCVSAGGANARLLPWWYDVDDVGGLARLALRIRIARIQGIDPGLPGCERLLEELAEEGLRF
jgi:hypothetical protein